MVGMIHNNEFHFSVLAETSSLACPLALTSIPMPDAVKGTRKLLFPRGAHDKTEKISLHTEGR